MEMQTDKQWSMTLCYFSRKWLRLIFPNTLSPNIPFQIGENFTIEIITHFEKESFRWLLKEKTLYSQPAWYEVFGLPLYSQMYMWHIFYKSELCKLARIFFQGSQQIFMQCSKLGPGHQIVIGFWQLKQRESIPVGCVPPACWPYQKLGKLHICHKQWQICYEKLLITYAAQMQWHDPPEKLQICLTVSLQRLNTLIGDFS